MQTLIVPQPNNSEWKRMLAGLCNELVCSCKSCHVHINTNTPQRIGTRELQKTVRRPRTCFVFRNGLKVGVMRQRSATYGVCVPAVLDGNKVTRVSGHQRDGL